MEDELCQYIYHRSEHGYIGPIEHYPLELHDNEYITTGYRIGFAGVKNGFRTLFIPNNETFNVWSHLLGKIFFFCLLLYVVFFLPVYGEGRQRIDQKMQSLIETESNFHILSFISYETYEL